MLGLLALKRGVRNMDILPNTRNLPVWPENNTDPKIISDMVNSGSFFSWQDGVWRYMPHSGTVHRFDGDPTENWPHKATFGRRGGSCDPEHMLCARIHPDGTRGIHGRWSRDSELTLRALYAPKDADETRLTAWILEVMP